MSSFGIVRGSVTRLGSHDLIINVVALPPLQHVQPLPSGCRHPEPEPIPPSIDNWARGAVPCRPISLRPGKPPSAPTSNLDQEESIEGGLSSVTMPEAEEHTQAGDGKGNGTTTGDAPPGTGTSRPTNDNYGNQNDGRAWGRVDEEGEVMGLLATLSEGGHRGGEETLIGAGDIGDAIGRRRRQEERIFHEVCLDEYFLRLGRSYPGTLASKESRSTYLPRPSAATNRGRRPGRCFHFRCQNFRHI